MTPRHSLAPLLSYGALFSFCQAIRGFGKSFPMLVRTISRAQRHHRGVVWLRRTEGEIDAWLDTFGSDKWLKCAKIAGVDFDRLKRRKNIIYYNDGRFLVPDWKRMIRAGALVQWNDFRDTDDPREELLILDEAFCTVEKRNRYAGDEVHDFLDIFASLYREGENDIRALIMGNEEMANNPYFDYLGMKRPDVEDGIVRIVPQNANQFPARYGAVVYERRTIRQREASGLAQALAGTAYGGFLNGDAKGIDRGLIAPLPRRRTLYVAADFGRRVTIWSSADDDMLVVSMNRAPGETVRPFPDGQPDTVVLCPDVKKKLVYLRQSFHKNRVRFDSPEAYQFGVDAIARMI